MLFLPELVPRNVQQSTGELDEELLLIQQEAQLKLEADSIRDYMRDTAPLGVALTTTSVEEPTPEEEEEEEEEEEGEDDDGASDGQDDEQDDTDDDDDLSEIANIYMAQQIEHIKWINGTNFMVDGFNFQNARCKNYFLTHFHSDHTTGLNRSFSSGVVYCSPITATLLKKDMGLPAERVIPLPVDTPHVIDGVTVILMDANHCPGACMMLFKVPIKHSKPQIILHTGDMRWQPRLADHPALKACKLEVLYMDTTYCLPKHVFPSQDNAIASLVKVMREAHAVERRTLFVVGSYHIGKERAFFGAARALGFKIWCHAAKKQVMQWCEMPKADMDCLVSKEAAAQIHVSFMGQGLQPEALEQRRLKGDYAKIVAFRPTGWSYQKKGLQTRREGNVTIYGIPYSEHSSFAELRDCVKRLRPKRIIPTVNCPDAASARAIVDRFADLMDLSRDKSRLDSYFGRTASAPVTIAAQDDSQAELTAQESCSAHDAQCSRPELDTVHEGQSAVSAAQAQDNNRLPCGSRDRHNPILADAMAAVQVKHEEEFFWEDTALDLPSQGCQQCFDVNEDEQHEQTLPMRSHPIPDHAHSAPAVLSPPSRGSDSHVDSSAPRSVCCVPVHDDAMPVALAMPCHQSSTETDRCTLASAPSTADTSTRQHADACSTDMAATRSQTAVPKHEAVLSSSSQCRQPRGCSAEVLQPCLSLLDDVDIAEQSRILCAIQQHQLYTKHCLTSKKRQMTLGDFVAPKRLK